MHRLGESLGGQGAGLSPGLPRDAPGGHVAASFVFFPGIPLCLPSHQPGQEGLPTRLLDQVPVGGRLGLPGGFMGPERTSAQITNP